MKAARVHEVAIRRYGNRFDVQGPPVIRINFSFLIDLYFVIRDFTLRHQVAKHIEVLTA
jgi:hypothetical protein